MTEELQSNLSLEDMDRHSLFHGYTSIAQHDKDGPFILDRGSGINITGHDGKEYLDAVAGLWCVNLGWGRREIIDAISAQLEKLSYYHIFTSLSNEPAIRLAHRILQLAPPNMSKVFFGNSGSDANDTNVKLVWYYNNLRGRPEKRKIISREFAYHGVTIGAGSLTGLPMVHKLFNLPIADVLHVEKPHHYWNAPEGQSEAAYAEDLAERLDRADPGRRSGNRRRLHRRAGDGRWRRGGAAGRILRRGAACAQEARCAVPGRRSDLRLRADR